MANAQKMDDTILGVFPKSFSKVGNKSIAWLV